MMDICVIVLVLLGIALAANIAVWLYTLYMAKKAKRTHYLEGYARGFLESETNPAGNYTYHNIDPNRLFLNTQTASEK